MKVIVDTGPWSDFFRQSRTAPTTVAQEVRRLVTADAIQMLGPIRQELLSGARPDARFEQLREYLRFYPNLPLKEMMKWRRSFITLAVKMESRELGSTSSFAQWPCDIK